MDERLTVIETKLAFLEDMVMTLNELVVKQQRELEMLYASKEQLENRLNDLAEMAGSDIPQRRPPHY